MASLAMCSVSSSVSGLSGSSLSTRRVSKSNVNLKSAFLTGGKDGIFGSSAQVFRPVSHSRTTCFARDWLRKDFTVIGFGLVGWLVPSSIPAINGNSLTGLFFSSIGPELEKFPVGPSVDSPFWLWLVLWHTGLFIVLTLGQIGFKSRGDGYFKQ